MFPNYGYLGNGITGMLINENSNIEWLSLPQFDSDLLIASILNKSKGGYIKLFTRDSGEDTFLENFESVHLHYLNYYPILVNILMDSNLTVHLIDYMPHATNCYLRRLTFYDNPPEKLGLTLKFFDDAEVKLEKIGNIVKLTGGNSEIYLSSKHNLNIEKDNIILIDLDRDFFTELHFSFGGPCGIAHPFNQQLDFWKRFFENTVQINVGLREISEIYKISLQVLHNLIYHPTGAVLAAPTTSIPDTLGKDGNWDYRYCWVRDACFTSEALSMSSCFTSSRRVLDFLFSIQGDDGHWEHPLYTINGKKLGNESVLDIPEEYGGKIRIGNAASDQFQIDSEGLVINSVLKYYQHSGDINYLKETFPRLKLAADVILDIWDLKENGIWEFRGERYNYVYGKAICAVGLRDFITICKVLSSPVILDPYKETFEAIMKKIDTKGWSESQGSFVQSFEKHILDSSVLALSLYELIPIDDPKMMKTVDKIVKILDRDGGFARYPDEEHPFFLSTFWLARHFTRAGKFDRYYDLLSSAIFCSNSLGLMAEHFYPSSLEQRGNFPQSFSHEEYIKTILEGFFDIRCADFQVVVPIDIFKSSEIHNFKFLGKDISLKSHIDEHLTKVYLKTPEEITFLIPCAAGEEISVEGGRYQLEEPYFKIVPATENLVITI